MSYIVILRTFEFICFRTGVQIAELEQKTSHIIEAVRCTRLLLEASLSDSASATPPDSVENKELSQQPGSQREHDIKMLYSLAVVR